MLLPSAIQRVWALVGRARPIVAPLFAFTLFGSLSPVVLLPQAASASVRPTATSPVNDLRTGFLQVGCPRRNGGRCRSSDRLLGRDGSLSRRAGLWPGRGSGAAG